MDTQRTVRAWKDEFYRQSLSTEERTLLPMNPIGEIELTETELFSIHGGVVELSNRSFTYGPDFYSSANNYNCSNNVSSAYPYGPDPNSYNCSDNFSSAYPYSAPNTYANSGK